MKIHLTKEEVALIGRYMNARDEYKAATEAAGPKLVALADLFDGTDVQAPAESTVS